MDGHDHITASTWECEVCTFANAIVEGQFNCIQCDHYQFRETPHPPITADSDNADPDPSTIIPEECKEFPALYHQDLRRRYYRFHVNKHVESLLIPSDIVNLIVHYIESGYCEGDKLEAQDYVGKWYVSLVKQVDNSKVFVHFCGWADKFDEWIEVDSKRLAPLYTHTDGIQGRHKSFYPVYVRVEADIELLTQLVDMGFTEVASRNALCATGNDIENALQRLLVAE